MAIYFPEPKKTVGGFGKNLIAGAGNLGVGMFMGPLALGAAALKDVGSMPRGDFDFSNTGQMLGGAAKGWWETSPIPSLLTRQGGEAWDRFYADPAAGALDFAGVTGGVSRGFAGAGKQLGRAGIAPDFTLGTLAAYDKVGKARDFDSIAKLPRIGDRQYRSGGIVVGDDVWARPTHRLLHIPERVMKTPRDDFADTVIKGDPELGSKSPVRSASDYIQGEDARNLEHWQRRAKTPVYARLGDEINRFRGEFRPEAAQRRAVRAIGKRYSRDVHVAMAQAKDMNAIPVDNFYKRASKAYFRGVDDGIAKKIMDHAIIMAAAGYRLTETRLEDFSNIVRGTEGKLLRSKVNHGRVSQKLDEITPRADELQALGRDRTPEELAEMKELFAQRNRLFTALTRYTSEIANASRFLKKVEEEAPNWNPLSGIGHETRQLTGEFAKKTAEASFLVKNQKKLDELLNSPEMEELLDKMEVAANHRENLARENYAGLLTDNEILENRFRMADVYHAEGISQRTMDRYRRTRADGTKRDPIFIPMRAERVTTEMKNRRAPHMPLGQRRIGDIADPVDIERWGQLEKSPEIFESKHFEEMWKRLSSNALGSVQEQVTYIMPQALNQLVREGIVSLVEESGLPKSMNAPYVAFKEGTGVMAFEKHLADDFGQIIQELRSIGDVESAGAIQMVQAKMYKRSHGTTTDLFSDKAYLKEAYGRGGFADRVSILPTQTYMALAEDVIQSAVTLKYVHSVSRSSEILRSVETFNSFWKKMILHLRPKWMWNNMIGSFFLLSLQRGIPNAMYALAKNSRIAQAVNRFLGVSDDIVLDRGGNVDMRNLIDGNFGDVLSASGASTIASRYKNLHGEGGKRSRLDGVVSVVNVFNAKFFDNPSRAARVRQIIDRTVQHERALMDAKGIDTSTLSDVQVASKMLEDLDVRERIAAEVLEGMIDFQDLSQSERRAIAIGIPFWSWVKGSTKAHGRALVDNPDRLTKYAALGDEAAAELEEYIGSKLPEHARASMPLWNRHTLSFSGAPPSSTPLDVLSMGVSMLGKSPSVGSESPLSYLSPPFGALYAGASGKHPFFGTALDRDVPKPISIFNEVIMPAQFKAAHKAIFPASWRQWQGEQIGDPGYFLRPFNSKSITEHHPWYDMLGQFTARPQVIRPEYARRRYYEDLKR